jgi:hypothetical protein
MRSEVSTCKILRRNENDEIHHRHRQGENHSGPLSNRVQKTTRHRGTITLFDVLYPTSTVQDEFTWG